MLCTYIEEIMKSLKEEELSIDKASSMKLRRILKGAYKIMAVYGGV